jgi:RNA polymerase sigma-70 factor (ECF subfamily)
LLKNEDRVGIFPSGGVGIIEGAMTKNTDEIEKLVQSQLPALVLFAKQWKNADAEGIVQEAFLKLMKQKVFPDNPAAWLFTTVRNLAHNEYRSFWRRKRREFEVQTSKGLFDVSDAEQNEELLNALESLDLQYREIIVAKIWGGLTLEEIAVMTKSSRSNVHRKYQEGIRLLGNMLTEPQT